MASVSSRSVGVGSEVGELVDVAADDALQASGMYHVCVFTYVQLSSILLYTVYITCLLACIFCANYAF